MLSWSKLLTQVILSSLSMCMWSHVVQQRKKAKKHVKSALQGCEWWILTKPTCNSFSPLSRTKLEELGNPSCLPRRPLRHFELGTKTWQLTVTKDSRVELFSNKPTSCNQPYTLRKPLTDTAKIQCGNEFWQQIVRTSNQISPANPSRQQTKQRPRQPMDHYYHW